MHKDIIDFQRKYVSSLDRSKIQKFSAGDTITVGLKILDGATERIQEFIGVCIAIRNKGVGSNFIVKKETDGIEVRRNFMLYSPLISYIKVSSKGKTRRAKLYFLFNRKGKSARLIEKKF